MADTRVIELSRDFNMAIRHLLDKAITKDRSGTMRNLDQKAALVIRATPLSLLETGSTDIWERRKDIVSIRDGDRYRWDLVEKFRPEPKDVDDESFAIIGVIYNLFNNADEDERVAVYADVLSILSIVAKYKKHLKSISN